MTTDDCFLTNQEFINPLLRQGLQIITLTRSDAILMHVYKDKQTGGSGRQNLYDRKIDIAGFDICRLPCC